MPFPTNALPLQGGAQLPGGAAAGRGWLDIISAAGCGARRAANAHTGGGVAAAAGGTDRRRAGAEGRFRRRRAEGGDSRILDASVWLPLTVPVLKVVSWDCVSSTHNLQTLRFLVPLPECRMDFQMPEINYTTRFHVLLVSARRCRLR